MCAHSIGNFSIWIYKISTFNTGKGIQRNVFMGIKYFQDFSCVVEIIDDDCVRYILYLHDNTSHIF